ncbi:MAG: glycoside hydrolase family 16 protein, partial [Ruminococcus sp.]|nr:glycoside hydrolase family 16 protein [Ruminococcus sp.]
EWLGAYDGKTPLTARYQWATYNKDGYTANNNNNQQPQTTTQGWDWNWNQTTTTTTQGWDWNWNQTTTTTTQAWNPPTTTTQGAQNALGIKDFGTPLNSNATMIADFRKGASSEFFASEGWTNGKPFDCWWYKENTSLSNGMLELSIDRERNANDKNPDWDPNYSGAEYRTQHHYGFGYYEVSMQAMKNSGVNSSFFTYTGPSEDNPWDEVDIEILGKDTTKVQLNYYRNGQGGHEFMYDLGFDSSEGFHTYGFDWQPDHITWYVDGKEAHTMYGDMPKTESRIMMNAWPGRTVDEWLGAYDGKTPLTARYQWVTYTKK